MALTPRELMMMMRMMRMKTALTPQEFSFSCRVSPSKSFRGESGAFAEIRFSRFQSLFFLDLAYFQQRGGSAPLIPRGVPFARLALKRRRTTWNLNFRSLRLFRRNFATASSEYENWSLLPTLRMQRKI